ncbi:recombinase family protein [Nocardioides sp. NPDC092400]|uniref:recombinase family protein n=1 Tax=Nocardioides sp. NPDC092400 TaxID=3155196 RepID=UPI00341C64E8
MTKAGVYVRISQDRTGAGLGVERQRSDCQALAERLGYEVVDVYCDNDTSAYSGKPRPEYQRLLDDIRAGRIQAVVCWHTDRLHRSLRELETYIDIAESVPTHTVQAGHLDLATASGRMTARITGAVARHESEHKAERQRRKVEELASKGLPLGGGRPFGYEADGLTLRPEEADELRGMVRRVLDGDSLGSILRDLNERGVRTTRGGTWGYTSLRSLLLRERNAGRMVHRGQVIGKAAWEPIVSETEHDAVVAVLSDPTRRTTPGPGRRHLLSGLAKCHCGAGLKPGWVASRNGRKHWIYTCPSRTKGHVHRDMARVDAYVESWTLDVLSTVSQPKTGDAATQDRLRLERERADIDGRLRDAATLFASGAITAAQLSASTELLRERAGAVADALITTARGSVLDGALGITDEQWRNLPLERKRRIIDAIMTITVVPLEGRRRGDLGVNVKLRTDRSDAAATPFRMWRTPAHLERLVTSAFA